MYYYISNVYPYSAHNENKTLSKKAAHYRAGSTQMQSTRNTTFAFSHPSLLREGSISNKKKIKKNVALK